MEQLATDLRKLAKCLRHKVKSTSLKKKDKSAKILRAGKSIKLLKARLG